MVRPNIITMDNVSFSYDSVPILEDVTVSIPEREFACIIGPNGGGKTTLVKLMLGLLEPTAGSLEVFGTSPERSRRRIGYVPQSYQYDPQFPVRVMDVVLMGRLDRRSWLGFHRRADFDAARRALEQVELLDLCNRPLSALSGGQRQRVLIARALASEPDLLILDEPTSSLDLAVETELYTLLDKLNERLTVVMVSHDIGFVSHFVSMVICVKRKVVVHPTSAITGDIICEVYGDNVCMVRHDHTHNGGVPRA